MVQIMSISEVTRRNIFDHLEIEKVNWSGRLDDVAFLSRIFDLNKMRSFDHRYNNAAHDIYQHTVMNSDWELGWIYSDSRFDLLHCEDEVFLRFLCEMIHPVVRQDAQEVDKLLGIFNKNLSVDGWQLVEVARISDKPVFAGRPAIEGAVVSISVAKDIANELGSDYIGQQITRMEAAINKDPELAIGTAKEFIETICKTILQHSGETVSNHLDLIQLVKQVRGKLELLPEDVPDKAKGAETLKRLLSNLGTIAQCIAELRGLYGSGHGKDAGTTGLKPRHARLVVSAASALGVFLFETYDVHSKTKRND